MAGLFNLTQEKQINKVIDVEIRRISLNPSHSMKQIRHTEIDALADSISQNGILKPLSVRKIGDTFQLIAGERRLRAAKMCELQSVPCIVYEMNDKDSVIIALVETIQSQNLSFFDESMEIEKLINYCGLTQEEAAAKLGKAQSTIANKLRLLRLSAEEQELISLNNLTERHARALLKLGSADDRMIVLNQVIENKLNVEKTEDLIENYIGKRKNYQSPQCKPKVLQNITNFINSIAKTIDNMQTAGINAESRKIQGDGYVEYRVRIPVNSI